MKTKAKMKIYVATSQRTPIIARKFQNLRERHIANSPSEFPEETKPADT